MTTVEATVVERLERVEAEAGSLRAEVAELREMVSRLAGVL